MAKENALTSRPLSKELLASNIYKPSQGRMVRQLTCGAIWLAVAMGVWQLYEGVLEGMSSNANFGWLRYVISLTVLLAGGWIGYRLVNWPKFADFLISVEAELNKVSWPTWLELVRASLVVIFTIFFLATILFVFDYIWTYLFDLIGIGN